MSPNSCAIKPENDLKSNGFLGISRKIATKREQADDKLMVIKLFVSNYARDLI